MHVCAFYNKIWVIDTWVYSSFEEKRYGWTHIDKFTARHDMLYIWWRVWFAKRKEIFIYKETYNSYLDLEQ